MIVCGMSVPEMQNYRGTGPKPEDFDAFWASQLHALSLYNPDYTLEKAAFQLCGTVCCDLNFRSFDGSEIHCKLSKPDKGGKFPLLFWFHGYKSNSVDWWHKAFWAGQGFCIVAMDVRGQGGPSQDLTSGYGSTSIGQLIAGVDRQKEDMTFLKVYKDIICMVRLARSLEFVDPEEILVHGASQGGGLALVTAALFPEIKKAAVAYPFLSDFRKAYELDGTAYEELPWFFRFFDPLHEREEELFRKLAYVDVKNFAPSVKAEVILATGLKDEVCPPPTQYAVFNNLSCPKKQYLYPDYGHEDLPGFTDLCALFLTNRPEL